MARTLADVLAQLSPEEQQAYLDKLRSRGAYLKQVQEHPVLARVGQVIEGVGGGWTNAMAGLATLPIAATNALGLTDPASKLGATASTPVLGPGGYLASSPEQANENPFYKVGNLGGFVLSLFTGGAEAQLVKKLFGGAEVLAKAGFLKRAAAGAAELGAVTFTRSQGELDERLEAGLHALPAGATMGIAGRPMAAGEGRGRYVLSQFLRQGAAGAVVPTSPVDVTGVPVLDSALFNSLFGAGFAVAAPPPASRRKAAVIDTAQREQAASDVVGTLGIALNPTTGRREAVVQEGGIPIRTGAFTPFEPLSNKPAVDLGQRSLFPDHGLTTSGDGAIVAEPTPNPIVDEPSLGPRVSEGLPPGWEDTPFGPARIQEPLKTSPDLGPGPQDPAELFPEPRTAAPRKLTATLGAIKDNIFAAANIDKAKDLVLQRLQHLRSTLIPENLNITLSKKSRDNVAAAEYWNNNLIIYPGFFTLSPAQQVTSLVHEMNHIRNLAPTGRDIFRLGVTNVAKLFSSAGLPSVPITSESQTTGAGLRVNLAQQVAKRFFPEDTLVAVSIANSTSGQTIPLHNPNKIPVEQLAVPLDRIRQYVADNKAIYERPAIWLRLRRPSGVTNDVPVRIENTHRFPTEGSESVWTAAPDHNWMNANGRQLYPRGIPGVSSSFEYYGYSNPHEFIAELDSRLVQIGPKNLETERPGSVDLLTAFYGDLTSAYASRMRKLELNPNPPLFDRSEFFGPKGTVSFKIEDVAVPTTAPNLAYTPKSIDPSFGEALYGKDFEFVTSGKEGESYLHNLAGDAFTRFFPDQLKKAELVSGVMSEVESVATANAIKGDPQPASYYRDLTTRIAKAHAASILREQGGGATGEILAKNLLNATPELDRPVGISGDTVITAGARVADLNTATPEAAALQKEFLKSTPDEKIIETLLSRHADKLAKAESRNAKASALRAQRAERMSTVRQQNLVKPGIADLGPTPAELSERESSRVRLVGEYFSEGLPAFLANKQIPDTTKKLLVGWYGHLFGAQGTYLGDVPGDTTPRLAPKPTSKAATARAAGVSVQFFNRILQRLDASADGPGAVVPDNQGSAGTRRAGLLQEKDYGSPVASTTGEALPVLPAAMSPAEAALNRAVEYYRSRGDQANLAAAERELARIRAEDRGAGPELTSTESTQRTRPTVEGKRTYVPATINLAEEILETIGHTGVGGRKVQSHGTLSLVEETPGVKEGLLLPMGRVHKDPVTGEVLDRQAGLFSIEGFVDKRVKAETLAGIRTADEVAASHIPPGPTTEQAHIAAASAGAQQGVIGALVRNEAAKGKRRKGDVQGPKLPNVPKSLITIPGALDAAAMEKHSPGSFQYLFDRGVRDLSAPGLTKTGTRERVGKRGKEPVGSEWRALRPDQRIAHVLLRMAKAGTLPESEYLSAVRAYSAAFKAVGQIYPSLDAIAKTPGEGARLDKLRALAHQANLSFEIKGGTPGEPRYVRLTERDSGRTTDLYETTAVALAIDANTRRLMSSPDFTPTAFKRFKLVSANGPGDGQPPLPPDSPFAQSGLEASPPVTADVKRLLVGGVLNQFRDIRSSMATLAKKVGDNDLYSIPDFVIQRYEKSRFRSELAISRMYQLARKHGVSENRGPVLKEATAALEQLGLTVMEAGGSLDAALAEIAKASSVVYAQHHLTPGEVAFLDDMRPEWDKHFRSFGIGLHKYVPGYISHWLKPSSMPALKIRGGTSSELNFMGLWERTHTPAENVENDYFKIYSGYMRSGYRHKYLTGKPNDLTASPVELLESLISRYAVEDTRGTAKARLSSGSELSIPRAIEPLAWVADSARGIPDPRRVRAISTSKTMLAGFSDAAKRAEEIVTRMGASEKNLLVKSLKAMYEKADVRFQDRHVSTLVDYLLAFHSARTFGINPMAVIRNASTSLFFVMPRVGVRFYSEAIKDATTGGFDRMFLRAIAAGAVKPSMPIEYHADQSRTLRTLSKFMEPYRRVDIWDRVIAYSAQEARTKWAIERFKSHADLTRFTTESGLSLLHPSAQPTILSEVRRGNYVAAQREHGRALADTALFDFSIANTPGAFRGVWGRLFGQYGRWSVGALETMNALVRNGTTAQKTAIAGLYTAAAAGVYGAGQALGVDTKDWIPFIHSTFYTMGPYASQAVDLAQAASGQPYAAQRVESDFKHDPAAFVLGYGTRNLVPGWTLWRALAAETNLSRRERRLLGVSPRRAENTGDLVRRSLGFRPITEPIKSPNFISRGLEPVVEPAGQLIREVVGEQP